jgi:Pentapeptide repeats (9 copies)
VSGSQPIVERCDLPTCVGARLQGRHCLEHLAADEFVTAVGRLQAGQPLDARYTTISGKRLRALIDALSTSDDTAPNIRGATFSGDTSFEGATFSAGANFNGATFEGRTIFDRAIFTGAAVFDDATFEGGVTFNETTFSGNTSFDRSTLTSVAFFLNATFDSRASFDGATFSGHTVFNGAGFRASARFHGATFSTDASFVAATFCGDTSFDRATFGGITFFGGATFTGAAVFDDAAFDHSAYFAQATFSNRAIFTRATFSGSAHFFKATFNDHAVFEAATFSKDALFSRATFAGEGAYFPAATFSGATFFDGAIFTGDAVFQAAIFERARRLGALVVGEVLVLDDCIFAERVTIEVAAIVVSARATTFAAGVHLRVRWAEIALDDADFARASTLSGATTWGIYGDLPPASIADDRHLQLEPRPRLITIRGAHVAALSLSNIDLRACRFFGAHGLESLRMEATCRWPHTPSTHRYIDRETIAEEHDQRGSSWMEPGTQVPAWLSRHDDSPLQPAQIAALYRALRKAREDGKDEAGAADLYYGEMEMRRHHAISPYMRRGRTRARSDRAVLTAYWLISGYGLKASRALITLLMLIIMGSLGLQSWGFKPDPPYTRALLYSIESTSSLFRVPSAPGLDLTYTGERIQIVLRLLGPLLIGLALLAVRARVKR